MARRDFTPPPAFIKDEAVANALSATRNALSVETQPISSYQNGWVDYGAPYAPASYSKERGTVRLSGSIRSGSAGAVAFTLPVGCRPSGTMSFAVSDFNGVSKVDVASDGSVTVSSTAATARVSLDGISFNTV